MREIIERFLKEKGKSMIPLQVVSLNIYIQMLKDFGYELNDNGECLNGFSVDFSYPFVNKAENSKVVLVGSLWYGNYILEFDED